MNPTLLIVEDEKNTREGLARFLEESYEVYTAEDARKALNLLEAEKFDLLLTDLKMPGEIDGMELVQRAMALSSPPICIVMTAYGSVETAVEAMKKGAHDYLIKPVNLDHLEMVLKKALRNRNLESENVHLRQQLDKKFGFENIVGKSGVMQGVFETVRQVASSRATVLIQGESGTGKELIAHAIHQLSSRAKAPFVAVHCAALSPTLLESELFGHEKGAFTGATDRRIGRFEAANGGTIFLDEIGEIDAAVQVKLLRVLGERSFERVGGNKTLSVDVRLVTATNRNLDQLVKEGKFRDDLYFRLKVVTITLPPLRERREDIPLMIHQFLKECNEEHGKSVNELKPEVLDILMNYFWPGNVRELRTTIESMIVLARQDVLTLQDVPTEIRLAVQNGQVSAPAKNTLNLEETEKHLIERALIETNGNRTEAARKIGISRRTLHRKLKEYKIENL